MSETSNLFTSPAENSVTPGSLQNISLKRIGFTVFIILAVVLIMWYSRHVISGILLQMRITGVVSNFDNETYNVVGSYDNKKDAAETLSRVNVKMLKFLEFLKNKYNINSYNSTDFGGSPLDSPVDHLPQMSHLARDLNNSGHLSKAPVDQRTIATRIVEKYNPEVLYENDPALGDGTAYTINKGQKLMLCLRNKHNPDEIISEDLIVFVILHELAHMGNENWGHELEFWQIFKIVLIEAIEAGIYTPVDYKSRPQDYCGLMVDYNPYYDNTI